LRNLPPIASATLEPQGVAIPVRKENGSLHLTVDSFSCGQLVVLHEP
jgi:hypothetical protein